MDIIRRDPVHPAGKPHVLSGNKASPRPWRMLFLDVETRTVRETDEVSYQAFRVGVTCYHRRRTPPRADTVRWHWHRSAESMLETIQERAADDTILYVIASNPSFDLWILRWYHSLAEAGWEAQFVYEQGMRFILTCKQGDRKIVVLGLQNYIPTGIDDIGEWIGREKMPGDPREKTLAGAIAHCERDVDILRDAFLRWLQFVSRHDMGGFRYTSGAQMMQCFRHRHMQHRLWVHREPEVLEMERDAYFGGRVGAWQVGTITGGPFVELDVNSMYPHVMQQREYPIDLRGVHEEPDRRTVETALRQNCVVADVTLDAEDALWPTRKDRRVVYPVGTFRTTVCTWGLSAALELDQLAEVHRMAVYRKAPVFRDMVSEWYEIRRRAKESGDKVLDAALKKMLNTLFGKFGQAVPRETSETTTDDPGFYRQRVLDLPTGECHTVTQLMHRVWAESGREEGRNSMPAIAAHVTEYARFYLAEIISAVGWDRIIYCDTDSVLIREEDMDRLEEYIHPTELGALSVEGRADHVTVHGAKDYVFGDTEVIKGIKGDARRVEPGVYDQDRFPGLKSLLRAPRTDEIPDDEVSQLEVEDVLRLQRRGVYPVRRERVHLSREYRKGIVMPDGMVKPHVM